MPHPRKDLSLLDSLYKISQLAQTTENPREALDQILDEMIRLLPGESAAIELINPESRQLEIEALHGFPESSRETRLHLGEGITGWVALHGEPLIIADVRTDPRYVCVKPEIRSEMAVPLRGEGGQVIGVVNIDSAHIGAFDEEDLKILNFLTMEASRVINRIWHIHQLKEKAEHLETLLKIGRSIVIKRDLDEILQAITSEALTIMKGTVCALFFYDKENHTLDLRTISGLSETFDYQETLALGDSSIGTVILRRKMIEVNDLCRTEEHHFIKIIQQENLVSMLSSPISYEDDVIGVLNLYTNTPHRFNNEEKRLFETLSSLGAAAIQNARLYQRIFQTEENLRQNERLTTLGLLSAEIAHEIRNPLTVIRLLFESLNLEFPEQDPRNRDRQVIDEKLDQLEQIVTRVLHFGKARHDLKSHFDFNDLISDTLLLVRPKLKQCKVDCDFHSNHDQPLMIEVSKGQMQQALLNIIINATQAMPEGGKISIQTGLRHSEKHDSPIAYASITDTGHGIAEDLHVKIFESFLSGRHDGTGLGLAIVKRILKSHHGDVKVTASGPGGTCMEIWLPALAL